LRWALACCCLAWCRRSPGSRLSFSPGPFSTDEAKTPYEDVTTYNNFFELGTDKADPARNAAKLRTEPWSVVVDGACANPGRFALEDLVKPWALEENGSTACAVSRAGRW
jgi:methionine sulfoxide reductase catalytic subunit